MEIICNLHKLEENMKRYQKWNYNSILYTNTIYMNVLSFEDNQTPRILDNNYKHCVVDMKLTKRQWALNNVYVI